MNQFEYDVVIVGQGLNGLVSAQAVSDLGLKVLIIDRTNIKNENLKRSDTRTVAISEGSKILLDKFGIWREISRYTQPIEKIKVIDRTPNRKIDFFNSNKENNLGYIIKNSVFKNSIIKILKRKKNISIINGIELKKINYDSNFIISKFNKGHAKAKLLIAADGKKSKVRDILETPTINKSYNESALVVNFEHSKNHDNCAYEFFFENGPLALLPMKKEKNHQSSLVWSNNKNLLKKYLDCNEDLLAKLIEEKILGTLGKIKKIKSKQIFPLSAHINYDFYDKNVIYVGDSAHSIHPIAGQGWNLGLRDISNLYNLLQEYKALGIDIDSINFTKNYHDRCFYDAFRMFQVTDKLNKLFMKKSYILNLSRALGFDFIEHSPKVKKNITNFAMGF